MNLKEHERIIKDQIKLAKIWLDVCQEQSENGYDWERTKQKILSDWDNKNMTLEWWEDYMETSFVMNAIEHYVIEKGQSKD